MSSIGEQATGTETWEYTYEPRWLRRAGLWAAGVVIAIHLVFGLLLNISYTGVGVGWSDKLGLIAVGFVIAAAVLLVFRTRLRVGPDGVGVRNLVGERVFTWDVVRGLEYPDKGFSARLLLPSDEHVPVLAVGSRDGDRAVDAMETFRELYTKYATQA
ncbi:hypothetical protein nbrc107696_31820 [Gordonia spumicola]|uniref:Low molecular weight protein antigen 6 PH domain-containing protein n=1 Tax=Gordonia spumicola TaxID=589161 RepID=A0A7I9VBJ2_9ACTN|nr:PH domain-containing protein [Gordonia spumicola]GEE02736.1 hypothetical protein nbrc107696_31820 [Gordonia spumicola]